MQLLVSLLRRLMSMTNQPIRYYFLPAAMGLAMIGVTQGYGLGIIAMVVLGYNLLRIAVAAWGLRVGLSHGLRVAHAISESWLPGAAPRAGNVAAVLIGVAVPLVASWLLRGSGQPVRATVLVVAGAVALGALTLRRPLSAPGLTVGGAALTLLLRWSTA